MASLSINLNMAPSRAYLDGRIPTAGQWNFNTPLYSAHLLTIGLL